MFLRSADVRRLRPLGASAPQNHKGVAVPCQMDSKSGAKMLAQLQNAIADRLASTEKPGFKPLDAETNPCLRLLVAQRSKPIRHRLRAIGRLIAEDFDHTEFCNL